MALSSWFCNRATHLAIRCLHAFARLMPRRFGRAKFEREKFSREMPAIGGRAGM
jgi:hypothetical protein